MIGSGQDVCGGWGVLGWKGGEDLCQTHCEHTMRTGSVAIWLSIKQEPNLIKFWLSYSYVWLLRFLFCFLARTRLCFITLASRVGHGVIYKSHGRLDDATKLSFPSYFENLTGNAPVDSRQLHVQSGLQRTEGKGSAWITGTGSLWKLNQTEGKQGRAWKLGHFKKERKR